MAKKKKEEKLAETVSEDISEASARRFLTMDNGKRYEVVSEDGKYFRCGATQFRKSNPHILKVEGARDDS